MQKEFTKWLFGKDGALFHAVVIGNDYLVEELICTGADPSAASGEGYTPLHRAAQHGHRDIVELLISRGADPGSESKSGETPSSLAEANGHTEIVSLLSKGRHTQ